ncbi:MAG: ATP synthase F1 subunit delta [Desulfobacterales bacterium]
MRNLAIARRYAKALLLIGKEDGRAEIYRDELETVSNLILRDKALSQAICNPRYPVDSRKKVLQAIVDKINLSRVMKSFLMLLFDKGRIGFLNGINGFYQKLVDEFKGVARASIVSATVLSTEAVEKIRSALSKMTGKEIALELEEDTDLIGGIITRIGDQILDGSIKKQLINIRESLKRGERV